MSVTVEKNQESKCWMVKIAGPKLKRSTIRKFIRSHPVGEKEAQISEGSTVVVDFTAIEHFTFTLNTEVKSLMQHFFSNSVKCAFLVNANTKLVMEDHGLHYVVPIFSELELATQHLLQKAKVENLANYRTRLQESLLKIYPEVMSGLCQIEVERVEVEEKKQLANQIKDLRVEVGSFMDLTAKDFNGICFMGLPRKVFTQMMESMFGGDTDGVEGVDSGASEILNIVGARLKSELPDLKLLHGLPALITSSKTTPPVPLIFSISATPIQTLWKCPFGSFYTELYITRDLTLKESS